MIRTLDAREQRSWIEESKMERAREWAEDDYYADLEDPLDEEAEGYSGVIRGKEHLAYD